MAHQAQANPMAQKTQISKHRPSRAQYSGSRLDRVAASCSRGRLLVDAARGSMEVSRLARDDRNLKRSGKGTGGGGWGRRWRHGGGTGGEKEGAQVVKAWGWWLNLRESREPASSPVQRPNRAPSPTGRRWTKRGDGESCWCRVKKRKPEKKPNCLQHRFPMGSSGAHIGEVGSCHGRRRGSRIFRWMYNRIFRRNKNKNPSKGKGNG